MGDKYKARLEEFDWEKYETAYGSASKVPGQLVRLRSCQDTQALQASHELWCGLCHQHAYVSSAALPALSFILEVLEQASEQLAIEILDILLGFSICTIGSEISWQVELRGKLMLEIDRFKSLALSNNKDISEFAELILENLT